MNKICTFCSLPFELKKYKYLNTININNYNFKHNICCKCNNFYCDNCLIPCCNLQKHLRKKYISCDRLICKQCYNLNEEMNNAKVYCELCDKYSCSHRDLKNSQCDMCEKNICYNYYYFNPIYKDILEELEEQKCSKMCSCMEKCLCMDCYNNRTLTPICELCNQEECEHFKKYNIINNKKYCIYCVSKHKDKYNIYNCDIINCNKRCMNDSESNTLYLVKILYVDCVINNELQSRFATIRMCDCHFLKENFETKSIKHCHLSNLKYWHSLTNCCSLCQKNYYNGYNYVVEVDDEEYNICYKCIFSIKKIQKWFYGILMNPNNKFGKRYITNKFYNSIKSLDQI